MLSNIYVSIIINLTSKLRKKLLFITTFTSFRDYYTCGRNSIYTRPSKLWFSLKIERELHTESHKIIKADFLKGNLFGTRSNV